VICIVTVDDAVDRQAGRDDGVVPVFLPTSEALHFPSMYRETMVHRHRMRNSS
jgi:hypothetical protein